MTPDITPRKRKSVTIRLIGIGFGALVCTVVVSLILRHSPTWEPQVERVPPISAEPPHLPHPVFGQVHTTFAEDRRKPYSAPSVWERLRMELGLPVPLPPEPVVKPNNLRVGETEMLWSAGGYLYFHLLSSPKPVWQFAACTRTNLSDLASQDFLATFVSMRDKTNGTVAFGTNWLRHGNGIRVRQGQVLLARLVSDPAQVYALEITKQEMTRAVVYYVKKSL